MRIRPRVPADLPALAEALMAQQSQTRYPFRDPLPFPVEQFLHADDAVGAWTAELDDRPVGHACRTDQPRGVAGTDPRAQMCAAALGCGPADLTWIGAVFVAATARRHGIGRQLLQTVVDDARAHGRRPCLEVLPMHPAAMDLYLDTGWRQVGSLRPDWLGPVAGPDTPDVAVLVLPDPS